jgi:hypothetical protein
MGIFGRLIDANGQPFAILTDELDWQPANPEDPEQSLFAAVLRVTVPAFPDEYPAQPGMGYSMMEIASTKYGYRGESKQPSADPPNVVY